MSDLPAMDRCPFRKSGRHDLVGIVGRGSLTLTCCGCGAIRRVPGRGPFLDPTHDAAAAVAEASRLVSSRGTNG